MVAATPRSVEALAATAERTTRWHPYARRDTMTIKQDPGHTLIGVSGRADSGLSGRCWIT